MQNIQTGGYVSRNGNTTNLVCKRNDFDLSE